ncbi:MAG: hypothetical protein SH847_14300 [Roseiflexaceae bacterium]|nr:hypothetical protein [Roseiflexaceae bacterium]
MKIGNLPTPVYALMVAAVSLVILGVLWWPRSTEPSFSPWTRAMPQQQAMIRGAAQSVAIDPGAMELRVDDGLYTNERNELQTDLEQALAYVANRFGSGLNAPVTTSVILENGCSLHGVAYTDVRNVQVFTCDAITRGQAVAILAHEMTHQLAQDRYGPSHLHADLILSEGVATWAAGRYWLSGKPDFRTYVRDQRRNGVSYPLATHYAGLGVGAMNALYYQWASFVEFLINTYGRESFDRLYVSGAGDPGSADYAGVYGKGLPELELEWSAWIDAAK